MNSISGYIQVILMGLKNNITRRGAIFLASFSIIFPSYLQLRSLQLNLRTPQANCVFLCVFTYVLTLALICIFHFDGNN
jgi:hypothetical protein